MNSIADVWKSVLQQLRSELSETTIRTWFDEITPLDLRDATLYLYCPNDFKRGYIQSLFVKNIQASLKDIFSADIAVAILDEDGYRTFLGGEPSRNKCFDPNDEFTFDTFVVGPSNKLAYAAAQAVAQNPAQNYNPLFIYGDSGLGKTHLIYAIAHVIRSRNRNARIAYVKGDDLTNELVAAIQAGPAKSAEMREKYRQADLLLVDDVQFIAGRKQTQEEFFHTFNALYESGKQIVLTSDRPPKEMTQLEDRLRTRFEWGLMVDVEPPDYETRLAIIRNKAALLGINLPDRISSMIAENITANVRQIEGVLNKILAYSDLMGVMDEEAIMKALEDVVKNSNEYIPTPESIIEYISKYFGIEPDVLQGQSRSRDITNARQIAMYLIRRMTNLSLKDIGKALGNRDHSTVMHSLEKVEAQMRSDPAFAETVKEITTNINAKQ